MKCEYCELLEKKEDIIYADEEIVVAVKDKVATPGQLTVFPREHLTILEMVPPDLLEKCAVVANKVSIAIFEGLGSQGTNIIVQNGLGAGQSVPHFGIEIIPRQESDGLNFQWQPKQLMEDEIEITHSLLVEGIDQTGKVIKKEKKIDSKEKKEVKEEKGKKNYLLKSLRRLP